MVGSMFLSVFSFASTAILHCFIMDEDTRGDGDPTITPSSLNCFLEEMDKENEKKGVKDNSRIKKLDGDANNTGKTGGGANDME